MNWLYINQGGFLNTNFFFALVTFIVGLSAYRIYAKRRADRLREAATVVLSEIKTVVSKIRTIRQDFDRDGYLIESRFLLKSQNWDKYKYVLLPALTLDQWSALESFFGDVAKYDKAIEINDSYFDSNSKEIWISIHKHYLKMLESHNLPETIDNPQTPQPLPHALSSKIQYFTNLYINNSIHHVAYVPLRGINMAKDALANIDANILVSISGERLTKLATPRPRFTLWMIKNKP